MALPNVINEINTIKSTYLPKSGGTVTGLIRVPSFAIGKTGTNDSIHICAGTGYESGSLLRLDGNDHSTRPGEFSLWAGGTTYNKVLSGNINGNLTWCGSQIHTDATYSGVSFLKCNETLSYGWNGLQYFNKNMSASEEATQNVSPTADWYHIIRMNHANSNGYYVDLAACFHSDRLYTRRVANGSCATGWNEIPVLVHSWNSGTSWYRKYSDGWIEQGGSTYLSSNPCNLTFHLTFSNTNYTFVGFYRDIDDNAKITGCAYRTKYTSYIRLVQGYNDNSYPDTIMWYACGY